MSGTWSQVCTREVLGWGLGWNSGLSILEARKGGLFYDVAWRVDVGNGGGGTS